MSESVQISSPVDYDDERSGIRANTDPSSEFGILSVAFFHVLLR